MKFPTFEKQLGITANRHFRLIIIKIHTSLFDQKKIETELTRSIGNFIAVQQNRKKCVASLLLNRSGPNVLLRPDRPRSGYRWRSCPHEGKRRRTDGQKTKGLHPTGRRASNMALTFPHNSVSSAVRRRSGG
jgi:hypothetical protein